MEEGECNYLGDISNETLCRTNMKILTKFLVLNLISYKKSTRNNQFVLNIGRFHAPPLLYNNLHQTN